MPRPLILALLLAVLAIPALRAWFRAWRRGRRLARIATLGAGELEAYLLVKDPVVRDAAAERLAGLVPAADLVARLERLGGGGARSLARAVGAREPSLLVRALENEARAEQRLVLAQGIAATEEGTRALVAIAGRESATATERGEALDALERSPRERVRVHVRAAVEGAMTPTAELLWALSEAGEPEDALLAARFVAAESFGTASSACEAVFALLERGPPSEAARLREVLALGRSRVREYHAKGENPLADDLVARLEELEARLPNPTGVPS
ncbi:MAG TPA: hypothetical protein VFF73_35795 [Planctomycetota bacterium]|nr:hypothetical protein [Planctomycetota bacterium]